MTQGIKTDHDKRRRVVESNPDPIYPIPQRHRRPQQPVRGFLELAPLLAWAAYGSGGPARSLSRGAQNNIISGRSFWPVAVGLEPRRRGGRRRLLAGLRRCHTRRPRAVLGAV